jgi:hypothetical protein
MFDDPPTPHKLSEQPQLFAKVVGWSERGESFDLPGVSSSLHAGTQGLPELRRKVNEA